MSSFSSWRRSSFSSFWVCYGDNVSNAFLLQKDWKQEVFVSSLIWEKKKDVKNEQSAHENHVFSLPNRLFNFDIYGLTKRYSKMRDVEFDAQFFLAQILDVPEEDERDLMLKMRGILSKKMKENFSERTGRQDCEKDCLSVFHCTISLLQTFYHQSWWSRVKAGRSSCSLRKRDWKRK